MGNYVDLHVMVCITLGFALFWGILFTNSEQAIATYVKPHNNNFVPEKYFSPAEIYIPSFNLELYFGFMNIRLYKLVNRYFAKGNQPWVVPSKLYGVKVLGTSGFGIQLHITKDIPGTAWLLSITSNSIQGLRYQCFPTSLSLR